MLHCSQENLVPMKPPNYTSLPDSFWSKVDEPDSNDCWKWNANNLRGYGRFQFNGKSRSTHRLAAQDFYGAIPVGAHTLHTCDNPSCVNAKHLYFGSNQDNVDDRTRRGRSAKGEKANTAKLTEEAILAIRELRGFMSTSCIGDLYGVNKTTIRRVLSGEAWSHV